MHTHCQAAWPGFRSVAVLGLALLALFLAHPPPAHARKLRSGGAIATPNYTIYHRKEVLLAKVANIVQSHPDVMSMTTRTAGDNGYNVSMQVVDVDFTGVRNPDNSNKVRILVDFGEHPREYISSELGLTFLQSLANPASIAALVGGGDRGAALIQQLSKVVFKILPMENERGRDLVEQGNMCERKNGRGVDPNRNWEVDWGKKEKDYDPQEEYPGTAPFSEPESRIVLDIAKTFKPHVWLNIHSGMEAMFTPWDHIGEVAKGAEDALRIIQTIKDNLFSSSCVVGAGGKSVGYFAHGTATDYMFERLKVPMPYTWEIYGDFKAAFNDCFRMFNPLTDQHVQSVITLWLKAIFRLVELLPTHPAIVKEGIFAAALPVTKGTPPTVIANKQTKAEAGPTARPAQQMTVSEGAEPVLKGVTINDKPFNGEKIMEADGTVLLVTPLRALNQGIWATLVVAVIGVAAVGFFIHRLTSTRSKTLDLEGR